MSYLKIKENIKMLHFAIIIVAIALATFVSAILLLLLYIMRHNDLKIGLVAVGIIILSIKPAMKTLKIFDFKNLIKLNRGKYPAPVEKPNIRYLEIKF